MIKKCVGCSIVFETENKYKKYCTRRCATVEKIECKNCFCAYERQRLSDKSNAYCSKKCLNIGKGRSVLVACSFCEKEHYKSSCVIRRNKKNFCSESCQHSFLKKRIERTCFGCGKKIDVIPSSKREKYYCNRGCVRVKLDYEDVYNNYVTLKKSADLTALKLGVSESSIFKFMKENNIESRYDGNSPRLECEDGDMVRSSYELLFDNELTSNGLEHVYDAKLPFGKSYLTDFLVGDVYVEIWGIVGIQSYEKKRLLKQKLYKENNLKLVDVFPCDFKNIKNKIDEIKRLL